MDFNSPGNKQKTTKQNKTQKQNNNNNKNLHWPFFVQRIFFFFGGGEKDGGASPPDYRSVEGWSKVYKLNKLYVKFEAGLIKHMIIWKVHVYKLSPILTVKSLMIRSDWCFHKYTVLFILVTCLYSFSFTYFSYFYLLFFTQAYLFILSISLSIYFYLL